MRAAAVLAWVLAEPRALWGLLLLAPVLGAHLLHRRRRRIVVPFLGLLLEARGPAGGGGLGRRLVDAAPLVCRLLAVVALSLAVARPSPAAPPPPRPLALVVDLDATTAARESDQRSRLEHLLALAAAEVRAHADGPVSVVLAAQVPRVFAQAESEREALAQRLLDSRGGGAGGLLAPAHGDGDLSAAETLARALVGPAGRVRVLSARAWEPDPATRVEVLGAGAADDDQGLVNLSVAAAAQEPTALVRVRVRNFAPRPCKRTLTLTLEGAEPVVRALTLAAGGEETVELTVTRARAAAVATISLGGSDAFAPNDALQLVLPPALRPSVLAVHDGRGLRPYTAALLAALGEQIDVKASGAVALADLSGAAARDVTLVDGAALAPQHLHPGAWLFLAPLAGALPFGVRPAVERPLVWRTRAGHPLVQDLELGDAWIARAFPLVEEPGLVGLAYAGADEPVLAEGERDGVRWIALGLDPEGSDLPVRAAFPLLVRNALLRLAQAPIAPLPPFVRTGELLTPRTPLPYGPRAHISWASGSADVEALTPELGWRVPHGAGGVITVKTGAGAATWTGRTAIVDLAPERSIVPARPPAPFPAPREDAPPPAQAWVRALLALAGCLLLLDLLLTRRERAGRAGVAMSSLYGSIGPWSTESSARP